MKRRMVLLVVMFGFVLPGVASAYECDFKRVTWALLEPDEQRFRDIFEEAYLPYIEELEGSGCEDPEGYEGLCQTLLDKAIQLMEDSISNAMAWHTLFYYSDEAEALRSSRCARVLLWFWYSQGWRPGGGE